MNKKKYLISAFALTLALAGCDYNDEYFEGLDEMSQPTQVLNKEYTLTDDDYAAIANNSTNKSIAKAAGVSDGLSALKTSKRFTDEITAAQYLPAYFAEEKWKGASNGSAIKVTYNKEVAMPDYLSQVEAAHAYTLTAGDYAVAWKDIPAEYFSPSKTAETYLPRILKQAVADAAEGDYAVVTYEYSSQDPSTGGEQVVSYDKIADAIAGGVGEYNVKGNVVATYARGFLVSDGTGVILAYMGSAQNVALGDEVAVKGTTSIYGGFMQFPNSSEVTYLSAGEAYKAPSYQELDAAAMDAYLTAAEIKPVKYTGTLNISGNYYNVNIDGAETAIGSIQYPAAGMVDPALNGQKVTVYGYTVGVSSKKYVNTMALKVVAEGTDRSSVIEAFEGEAGQEHTVQGVVSALYARGFMVSDGTANMLVYLYAMPEVVVGDVVSVTGTTSAYGGLTQFPKESTVTLLANGATVSYPTPAVLTGEDLDAYLEAPYLRYVSYVGTLKKSGNYYNVEVDGATKAQGSLQYVLDGAVPEELNGKKILVEGYTVGFSNGKYVNTMITSVTEATDAKTRALMTRAAAATETRYAVYQNTSDGWSVAADMAIVNPADYTKMEVGNNYFSSAAKPDAYLPMFLELTYPYAQEGDVRAAVYYYGSEGSVSADEYLYTAGVWTKNNYTEAVTEQFVLSDGSWKFNPSVTVTLVPGKNQPTAHYFQAITDWVKENHPEYVTSYGNNDYYYGGSAYQNNFDFRPSAWKQYGYADMSDADLLKLMNDRLPESFIHALETLHADVTPIEGVDTTFTFIFGIYDGSSTSTWTIQYKVVGAGQFEYVADSFKEVV